MTMADGGLRLFVDTQELTSEDKAIVMGLHKKIGWFIFADQPIQQEDALNLPEIKMERGEKTPSQRLRAVLYLLWDKKKTTDSFDIYYREYINRVIEKLKEGLD